MATNDGVTTTAHTKTITDPNAPERLRGRHITAKIVRGQLEISLDLPGDYTPQEIGYIRWSVGELLDKLRVNLPNITFGEPRMECPPTTKGD
jgi:hypothetical protein